MLWRAGLGALGAAALCCSLVNCDDSGETGGGGQGATATAASCDGGAFVGAGAFAPECGDCHGVSGDPAPPPDTLGLTDTTEPSVGAHQTHFNGSTWHRDIPCGECHEVPSSEPDPCVPTHNDGVVDVIWGPVAQQGVYDRNTHVCTNVYCHGALLQPDLVGAPTTIRAPTWTIVDGTQAGCGLSCHTHPPGGTHDVATDCPTCHFEVISSFNEADPAASVWADRTKHIDAIHQAVATGGAGGTG